MNTYEKWYGRVVWFGILVNLIFWLPALVAPSVVINTFHLAGGFETVWLRNVGILLVVVAIFNAAAAVDPLRYPLLSWFVVLARLLVSAFFLEIWLVDSLKSTNSPQVFMWMFITDFSFGVVKGFLLNRALPEESRLSNFLRAGTGSS